MVDSVLILWEFLLEAVGLFGEGRRSHSRPANEHGAFAAVACSLPAPPAVTLWLLCQASLHGLTVHISGYRGEFDFLEIAKNSLEPVLVNECLIISG